MGNCDKYIAEREIEKRHMNMPHIDAIVRRHGMPDNRQRKCGGKNTTEIHDTGAASPKRLIVNETACNAVVNAKGGLGGEYNYKEDR